MSFYGELAATSDNLLTQFGQSVTLTKKTQTPADANKPWRSTTGADTTVSAKAVLMDYTDKEVNGDTIRRGDLRAYVAPHATEEYREFDSLTNGEGTVFAIKNVTVLNPGGTKLLYEMQLRR